MIAIVLALTYEHAEEEKAATQPYRIRALQRAFLPLVFACTRPIVMRIARQRRLVVQLVAVIGAS